MRTDLRGLATTLVKQAPDLSSVQLKSALGEVVKFLAARGQLGRWRELEAQINKAWQVEYGVSKITVMSAHPLSPGAKTKLEKLAQGAEIQTHVDERLMGGAVVRLDDKRLDGTILGALSRLKQALLS